MNGVTSRLRLGAVELAVTSWGEPRAAGIVLLHGFLTSSHTWRRVAPALASAGHYTVAIDFPGSGESPDVPGQRWDARRAAELVSDALGALRLERTTLVGTQMGGSIAAWVAGLHPARLERLVVMAAGALGETARNLLLFRALARPWLGPALCKLFPAGAFRRKWLAAHGSAYAPDEAAIEYFLDRFRRTGSAQAAFALGVRESYGARFDALPPVLGRVEVPTLLLWGAEDRVVPLDTAQRFVSLLPRSTLITLPGCGDFPQEEAPDVVARSIASFCESPRVPSGWQIRERVVVRGEVELG